MEIGAIPRSPSLIERELDLLRNKQTSSGTFNNFGNIPDSRNSYFQTAYVLIPFLKFKRFVNKNYDDVINRGFSYLNGISSGSSTDRETHSIAAFAYALNGNFPKALALLAEAEKYYKKLSERHICLRNSAADNNCNIRHTSYAVIAYVAMNKFEEAKRLCVWILDSYKSNKFYSNTYSYAVSTEAISRFLIARQVSQITDFKVTVSNEQSFNKVVHITNANQKDEVEIIYPDYTLEAKMSIQGNGFCSITKIMQSTVALQQSSSKFSLNVTPLAVSRTNERTVRVCATYQPREDEISLQTLFNVIYDVEMPSGYTFKEIVNIASKPEIKVRKCAFCSCDFLT